MTKESLNILRHILDARIDNAADASAYTAWTSARDIIEYALADNIECLQQFDYMLTDEEEEELEKKEVELLRANLDKFLQAFLRMDEEHYN